MAVSSEAFILHNSRALAATLIKGTAWRYGARRRKGRARCPDRTRSGGGRVLVAGAADDDPNGIAIYSGSVSSFVSRGTRHGLPCSVWVLRRNAVQRHVRFLLQERRSVHPRPRQCDHTFVRDPYCVSPAER